MRKPIRFLPFTVGTLLLLATASNAADAVIDSEPVPPTAPVIDTSQWGGAYVGVYGGYTWFDAESGIAGGDVDGDGGRYGGYTGYNFQLDNDLVVGVEGQAGFNDADETSAFGEVERDFDASLRGRLGYAFESSLIYSFAGISFTDAEINVLGTPDSNSYNGFTVGGGLETFLTDSLTARVEYGFSDYGSEDFDLGPAGSQEIDLEDQSISLGLGVKF